MSKRSEPPRRERVTRHTHTPEQLDLLAALAESDTSDKLLYEAKRAATLLLDTVGSFTVGEVRAILVTGGIVANDGKEKLAAFGMLGRKMGCVSAGIERQPSSIPQSHGRHVTRWVRPTLEQRGALVNG